MQTNYLETKLSEYYAKNNLPREREKLSVSDTGCLLQRQLKLWGIKPDRINNFQEMMNFDYGNMMHYFLQKRMEDAELNSPLGDEFEVEDEYFIGHIDKTTLEDGKIVVNEFKTIKDYGLDMIEKKEGNEPKPEHVRQATNYLRMVKNQVKNSVLEIPVADYFRIIYVAKCFDDGHRKMIYQRSNPELAEGGVIIRIKEFTLNYNPALAEDIVEEAKLVLKKVQQRIPLACTEWDKPYHRDEKWNSYLSWCAASINDIKLVIERLQEVK